MSSQDSEAYEKIEYPSSGLSSDDQVSIKEGATNADGPNQVTERVYQLSWTTRDEIVACLNRYTLLFCGEKVETKLAKNKLMYENTDLYQALIILPTKASASARSHHSGRVTLDLDSGIRSQIVSSLIANHELTVELDSASEENKMRMVDQNTELIVRLARLPVNLATGSADETVPNDLFVKRSELIEFSQQATEKDARISRIIKKVDQLEKTNRIIERADDVLSKVGELSSRKVDLGVKRANAVFECELDSLEEFFESDKSRYSGYFFAGKLVWCLEFYTKVDGRDRFLSIYLHADGSAWDGDWSIKATANVSILSQSGGKNKSRSFNREFGAKSHLNLGWSKFISKDALRADGYIKNCRIKVQADLKLGELIRNREF